MIPLNFYRDDEYVYYNNPNGITKKMTIADFEAAMSGSGGGGVGGNTSLVLSVTYIGDSETVQAGDTFSYFSADLKFEDMETWEEVDLDTLDYDYCILLTFNVPQSTCLVNFAVPDTDAYVNFSLTVRNVSNDSITIGSNSTIAYIKLVNPRPISPPSEPGV